MSASVTAPSGRGGRPTLIVVGTLSRDGRTVVLVCPHCRRRHTHGVVDGHVGHRNAHCLTGFNSYYVEVSS